MDVTVSSKYQVVIPKAVRKQMRISPGQKLRVESGKNKDTIVISKTKEIGQIVDAYAGKAAGAWGTNPAATVRKMRDEEWRN